MENLIAILGDKLSLLAFCSSTPGNRLNGLEYAMRWVEKSKWAREAIEAIEKMGDDNLDPFFLSMKSDLQEIAEFPHSHKVGENARLNHALVSHTQIKMAQSTYSRFENYTKSA